MHLGDKANKDLRELVHHSCYLESDRYSRRLKGRMIDLKLIRQQAKSLYDLVTTERLWKCTCINFHTANLLLEPRQLDKRDIKLIFKLLLLLGVDSTATESSCGKCKWGEIEASLRDNEASTPLRDKERGTHRTVKFVIPHDPAPQSLENGRTLDGAQITDICSTVFKHTQGHTSQKPIGFLSDNNCSHNIYLRKVLEIPQEDCTMSLQDLIARSSLIYGKRTSAQVDLTWRDRLYIAATLASSVLQLEGTSWLKKQWRSSDIFFLKGNNTPSYTEPYVCWKVRKGPRKETATTGQIDLRVIRCEALFALGLTLIELSLGTSLEDMQQEEDSDPSTAIQNFNTAIRMLDRIYSEKGPTYGDVVRRCLYCPFDVRHFSLDNERFQQAVYQLIVVPLMDDLQAFKKE